MEWGFPKGRRLYHEKNFDCAVREFKEETGYNSEDYNVFQNVLPIKEVFRGTDEVLYKHIYFLSILNSKEEPEINDINEVGNALWCTYDNCFDKIRSYHTEKKRLLNDVFRFIVSTIAK